MESSEKRKQEEDNPIEGNFEWVTKDVKKLMETCLTRALLFGDRDDALRAIDVGCGTSQLAFLLAKEYDQVLGIDVNKNVVNKMSIRYKEVKNLRFVCMDIYESSKEAYDLVVDKSTLDVLLTLDPVIYLEKIRSMLFSKTHGRYATISFYKPCFVKDLLEASGLELVRASKFGDEQYVYISKRSDTLEPNEEKQKRVLSEIFIRNDRNMLHDELRMFQIREKMGFGSSLSLLETYQTIFLESEKEEYKFEDFLHDAQNFFQEKKIESSSNICMNADMALEFLRTMQ